MNCSIMTVKSLEEVDLAGWQATDVSHIYSPSVKICDFKAWVVLMWGIFINIPSDAVCWRDALQ